MKLLILVLLALTACAKTPTTSGFSGYWTSTSSCSQYLPTTLVINPEYVMLDLGVSCGADSKLYFRDEGSQLVFTSLLVAQLSCTSQVYRTPQDIGLQDTVVKLVSATTIQVVSPTCTATYEKQN